MHTGLHILYKLQLLSHARYEIACKNTKWSHISAHTPWKNDFVSLPQASCIQLLPM